MTASFIIASFIIVPHSSRDRVVKLHDSSLSASACFCAMIPPHPTCHPARHQSATRVSSVAHNAIQPSSPEGCSVSASIARKAHPQKAKTPSPTVESTRYSSGRRGVVDSDTSIDRRPPPTSAGCAACWPGQANPLLASPTKASCTPA